jgi:hypothetical protein
VFEAIDRRLDRFTGQLWQPQVQEKRPQVQEKRLKVSWDNFQSSTSSHLEDCQRCALTAPCSAPAIKPAGRQFRKQRT